jgi:hypothetical protein
MGTLTDSTSTTKLDAQKRMFTPAAWATHDSEGVPANCDALVDAWDPQTGVWAGKSANWSATGEKASSQVGDASGGLYGLSNVLNSADAAAFGIEPAAIANFWGGGNKHTDPGTTSPSLGEGDYRAIVAKNGTAYTLDFGSTGGWDAVSALFMQDYLYNDVMINPVVNGMTDWVVTFPTKREYVKGTTPKSPFTDVYKTGTATKPLTYAAANLACEPISVKQWNREESTPVGKDPVFSPQPPGATAATAQLCLETNTIALGGATVESVFGTVMAETKKEYLPGARLSFIAGEDEGWMRMGFRDDDQYLKTKTVSPNPFSSAGTAGYDGNGGALNGLPAMGFAAFKYVNGDRTYGFVSDHKGNVAGSAVGDADTKG